MGNPIFVLDTSVLIPWFFEDEPSRKESLILRDKVLHLSATFVVPHLMQSELAHVLSRKTERDVAFVQEALTLIELLGLTRYPLTVEALSRLAYWCGKGLSGYDATFLALAENLDGVWVTNDHKAARKSKTHAVSLSAWVRQHA